MKTFTSLAALLSLAPLAVSSANASQGVLSSCNARDRVIVETRNVTVGGHEIQISTKACSADVLASPSLEKRLVLNACGNDDTFTCVLEGGVPGPVRSDCTALENALPAFLASEGGPTTFTVAPQFAQEFTLGTCLWAWINNNPDCVGPKPARSPADPAASFHPSSIALAPVPGTESSPAFYAQLDLVHPQPALPTVEVPPGPGTGLNKPMNSYHYALAKHLSPWRRPVWQWSTFPQPYHVRLMFGLDPMATYLSRFQPTLKGRSKLIVLLLRLLYHPFSRQKATPNVHGISPVRPRVHPWDVLVGLDQHQSCGWDHFAVLLPKPEFSILKSLLCWKLLGMDFGYGLKENDI
ncbi:hypothetical protein B0H13DRAFT_1866611 [Mycena leptocephala]|nr:hypothetical protein B0H13DRAFT_1866611 [Mycena leptocephala]